MQAAARIEHLQMTGVVKRFPGVLANDMVSLEVRSGEILALLGENGAGKSTLMKVLYGMYRPDAGEIRVNGRPVRWESPQDAIRSGIGMVHQHFMLVPSLTVAENVVLGLPSSRGPLLDLDTASERIVSLSRQYGLNVNPRAYVWQLSVGEQQRVEILKALYRGADLLILDEPTAVLTPQEAGELISVLKGMAAAGRTIIFITHKLNEVMAVSERVAVLRAGRVAGIVATAGTDPAGLTRLMVGRDVVPPRRTGAAAPGPTVLSLEEVWSLGNNGLAALRGLNLAVHAGEIVGLAGVSGNGQKELAEAVAGLRRVTRGRVTLQGADITNRPPAEAMARGLGYVPEDRMHVGTIPSFAIWENLILKDHPRPPLARGVFLQHEAIRRHAQELVAAYGVKTPDLDTPTGSLSGGNIQRVVLAREISRNPAVLLAAYPTRGLDVGATEYVHQALLAARAGGMGILLVAEDLDEILALCDRIAVIYEGRIMGVLPAEDADVRQIGLLMAGMEGGEGETGF